jgi:diguanylate cyclase (GGDEF)-like protein
VEKWDAEDQIPLSALRPVARAITRVNSATDLAQTLQAVADGVTDCTPFERVAVNVVCEDGELTCVVVAGPDELKDALLHNMCPRKNIEQLLDIGEPWGQQLRFLRQIPEEAIGEVRVYTSEPAVPVNEPDAWLQEYTLLAPMYDGTGDLVGVLSIDTPSTGRIPPRWTFDVLEMFTEQASIAIINARRHEAAQRRMAKLEQEQAELKADLADREVHAQQLRHLARHDALTGLANPVELHERLTGFLADQIPIAVVFCDLDRFKEINDSRGHGPGDEVLRLVAQRLRQVVRGEDVVARVGGDEFVVVSTNVGSPEALALVDRIDQAFAHPMTVEGERLLVRLSLGLAFEPSRAENGLLPEERARELLSTADQAMYARKRSRAAFSRMSEKAWAHRESVGG